MHTFNQQALPAVSNNNPAQDDRLERLQLRVWKEDDPERTKAEDFIRERFQDSYAADVQSFMPYLLGVMDDNNEISAVIGFRPAGNEDLFLENYLDDPAEHALSEACGSRVQRQQIVEVGNLASSDGESFRILMIGLVTLLDRLPGTNWIMCTVGDRLFRLLRRSRFFPLVLEQADQQRLSPQQGNWGSYYQHARKVVAGNVSYGLRELKRKNHWRPEFAQQVNHIFRDGLLA
jgi:hypothetical protein